VDFVKWEILIHKSEPRVGKGGMQKGRNAKPLRLLMTASQARKAGLRLEELLCLRLYTGPMYVPYCRVLRGQVLLKLTNLRTVSRRLKKALSNINGQVEAGSNMYTASIHCICSGLRKLCRAQEVEAGLILFRGFGNMALPKQFFDADAQGCRGGVECGLMSTSPDREVAIGYSGVDTGKVLPTLFEIKVGKTSVAADISWLSQFEGEKEYLFGPLTHLQVVGQPEVVEHEGKEMSLVHLDLTVRAVHNLFIRVSQQSIPSIVVSVRDATQRYCMFLEACFYVLLLISASYTLLLLTSSLSVSPVASDVV
jgi:hypothetical protein